MENQAAQLFADIRDRIAAQPDAPVLIVIDRWAHFQWWRDEVKLLAASGHTPRAFARMGYRLLKLAGRTGRRKASGLKRRVWARLKG
jgi:hypothetical protein